MNAQIIQDIERVIETLSDTGMMFFAVDRKNGQPRILHLHWVEEGNISIKGHTMPEFLANLKEFDRNRAMANFPANEL